jgi:hypothetical protein
MLKIAPARKKATRSGKYRRRNSINERFSIHTGPMLESPAWRVLSRGAHQFLSRLEVELCRHGGHDSSKLPLTYEDLMVYGMSRNQIPPAMREAIALGFAECTRPGRAGNAEHRLPSLWRITYTFPADGNQPTDEWQRIKTMREAKAIARDARAEKDERAVRFGKNRTRYQKLIPNPVSETNTETKKSPVSETNTTGSVRKQILLSISGRGVGGREVVVARRQERKQRRVRLHD